MKKFILLFTLLLLSTIAHGFQSGYVSNTQRTASDTQNYHYNFYSQNSYDAQYYNRQIYPRYSQDFQRGYQRCTDHSLQYGHNIEYYKLCNYDQYRIDPTINRYNRYHHTEYHEQLDYYTYRSRRYDDYFRDGRRFAFEHPRFRVYESYSDNNRPSINNIRYFSDDHGRYYYDNIGSKKYY